MKVGTIRLLLILGLGGVLTLPLAWHSSTSGIDDHLAERVVVVTPHNEAIRQEFGQAFAAWAQARLGRQVAIDWRSPGGASEICRYLEDQFTAAFLRQAGHDLSPTAAVAFKDPRFDQPSEAPAEADQREARRRFLASDLGVGIDLFCGGGQFEFHRLAGYGFLVDSGLRYPSEVIPASLGGEVFSDRQGRYLGTCLSTFGICINLDRLSAAGLEAPRTWDDLGDPRYLAGLMLADPTKSGSINRCYELIVQSVMARTVAAQSGSPTAAVLDAGWRDGFLLLKRLAGNARAVTDSASRVTRAVGQGEAMAGLCIDFYGRSEAEWSEICAGRPRLRFITPLAGTSLSADPIGLLRGAPHRELAVEFIRFVLSPEGQRLWNYRPGEPGGPVRQALRRMPIRRDAYTAADRTHMSDPEADPYEQAAGFTYHPEWTGRHFALIRQLIKAVILDPRDELRVAWEAIIAAGGPAAVPEAMAALAWLPGPHSQNEVLLEHLAARNLPATTRLARLRVWTEGAQAAYRQAAKLARAKR